MTLDTIQKMIDDGLKVIGVKTNVFSHLSDPEDLLKSNFEYLDKVID